MFSEVLKITPKLEAKDAAAMENSLNARFKRVAKKFGGGIVTALTGAGVTGIVLGLVDKIMNPLKEVQETIAKTLSQGDDLATYAKQFNTTAGKLAILQAYGKSTGLEAEGVRMLLVKFQSAVAQSAANPGQPSAVSAFVGKQDTAAAFFEFIQSLKKLDPTQQNLVQQEVFGEKQILKASEFLNADFKELNKFFAGISVGKIDQAAQRTGDLKDKSDAMGARRELRDFIDRSARIDEKTILGLYRGEAQQSSRETSRLSSFDSLQKIQLATDKMAIQLEKAYLQLSPILSKYIPQLVDKITTGADALESARALRGAAPGAGKDK